MPIKAPTDKASLKKSGENFSKELETLIELLAKKHGFVKPPVMSIGIVLANEKLHKKGLSITSGMLRLSAKHKQFDPAQIDGMVELTEGNAKDLRESLLKAKLAMLKSSGVDMDKLWKEFKKFTEKK